MVDQHSKSLVESEEPVSPISEDQPESNYRDTLPVHEASRIDPAESQATPQSFASVEGKPTELSQSHPWLPSVLRRLPWLAFLSLFLTVACATCSVVVLVVSDGQKVEH